MSSKIGLSGKGKITDRGILKIGAEEITWEDGDKYTVRSFVRYYLGCQIREDHIGIYSRYGRRRTKGKNLNGRDFLEDLAIDGRIILK